MVKLNNVFESVAAARTAITKFVLDQGESYKLVKSDKARFVICCKDSECKFCIQATRSAKEVVLITVFKPHTCSPTIHYKSKQSQSVCSLFSYTILILIAS
jgi:MuDR family transposase